MSNMMVISDRVFHLSTMQSSRIRVSSSYCAFVEKPYIVHEKCEQESKTRTGELSLSTQSIATLVTHRLLQKIEVAGSGTLQAGETNQALLVTAN
jgi:hypothetical protein